MPKYAVIKNDILHSDLPVKSVPVFPLKAYDMKEIDAGIDKAVCLGSAHEKTRV
ncbi:Uncharacterised protein [uncultured archaeon]|nr:Uncharacterised protein [uncultured archaeon]